jgi:hypothetical protein
MPLPGRVLLNDHQTFALRSRHREFDGCVVEALRDTRG